jgi:hypothetical protein
MSRRLLVALIATLALIAAACGDDADDASDVVEESPSVAADDSSDDMADEPADEMAEPPPMGPAELTVDDQSGAGATVVITSVMLPAEGFIAIHSDAGGNPGPVIGHSDLLPAGVSTDVIVTLDEPLVADTTLWPMVHIDTNRNGTYDFDPPTSTEDGPGTFEDGTVAVLPLAYTIE